jgi:hypothetical protein
VQRLVSGDKRYELRLTAQGSAVLLDVLGPTALWTTAGSAANGIQLCIHTNGSLVLTGAAGRMLWSRPAPAASAGVGPWHLLVADGNLALRNGSCKIAWLAPLGEAWLEPLASGALHG